MVKPLFFQGNPSVFLCSVVPLGRLVSLPPGLAEASLLLRGPTSDVGPELAAGRVWPCCFLFGVVRWYVGFQCSESSKILVTISAHTVVYVVPSLRSWSWAAWSNSAINIFLVFPCYLLPCDGEQQRNLPETPRDLPTHLGAHDGEREIDRIFPYSARSSGPKHTFIYLRVGRGSGLLSERRRLPPDDFM